MTRTLAHAAPWTGEVYRSASPSYASKEDVITGAGSRTAGARWNPPRSFRTIYTSLDLETAVAEGVAHFRHYGFRISKAMPRVIVSLEVELQRLLDLTDGVIRRLLGVSQRRMLAEPWRQRQKEGREALTQAIGRLAYEANLEGILVPSAACATGSNLVLFPANFDPPKSWLRIINKEDLPRPP
jgi:RES domain-containing protein